MKKLYIFAAFMNASALFSQGLCPFLGPDQYLPCGTNSTTLTADFTSCPGGAPAPNATTSYTVSNIPFAPQAVGGTAIAMTDDSQQGPFNIGFSFCFFGNTYTQFYIGSNGWISFSGGQPTTFTSASIPSALGTIPKNCIMGPWQDWHPGVGAGPYIRYQTQGVAPCRRLVVSWTNIPMYSCTGNQGTFQIVLYESTNIIENHITRKPGCAWAGGTAVQGIHNAAGTVAVTVPGRNSTNWTITPPAPPSDAYRWTPSGAAVAATLTWYQVGNPVAIGTGSTITVTPPAAGASYTCHPEYPACYSGYATCMGFSGASGPDTVFVQPGPPNIYPSIPGPYDFCPGTTITVGTDQPYANYTWSDGSTGATYTSGTAGPISVNVIDTNGCTGTANAVLNMWPNPVITVLPVDPYICPGETVQMTANGAVYYTWNNGGSLDNTTSNVVNASPMVTTQYTIVGQDANGCIDSTTNYVYLYTPPTVTASSNAPGVCPTYSTGLQANGAVNYSWSPATGLSSTNIANPTATLSAPQSWTIIGTDANGCSDTTTLSVTTYDVPTVSFSAPVIDGCTPVSVNLVNNSAIASGTIASYVWNIEGVGTLSTSAPSFTISNPGSYDVQLIAISDNGCVDSMEIVDYINVYSIPTAGFYATPQPANIGDALIAFTNTSTIDATNFLWDFAGLGTSSMANPSYEFTTADTFDVTLIAITPHGCSDTVMQSVIVEDVSEIWIPNGFTANGDGLNDTWFPIGRNLDKNVVSILVEVFDRWGELVYSGSSSSKPWDGYTNNKQLCPQGVYAYNITFTNEKGKEFNYKGHVTLVR